MQQLLNQAAAPEIPQLPLTGSNLLHWKMTLYLEKMTTEHSRNLIMS